MEFLARLEQAWAVCDKFDLQTEIWRGRILKAVRDREKRGERGVALASAVVARARDQQDPCLWLDSVGGVRQEMLGEGVLEESSVNQFSKRAFMERPRRLRSAVDDFGSRQ